MTSWDETVLETEDCSNDAENSVLITGINYILQYIQRESIFLYCNNISHKRPTLEG